MEKAVTRFELALASAAVGIALALAVVFAAVTIISAYQTTPNSRTLYAYGTR
jgi:hypothetical protein